MTDSKDRAAARRRETEKERAEREREKERAEREKQRAERAHDRQEAAERAQQKRQQRRQDELGIEQSPPPYEVPETPLERLGAGFGYMGAWIGGALVLNLLILALIAAQAGG